MAAITNEIRVAALVVAVALGAVGACHDDANTRYAVADTGTSDTDSTSQDTASPDAELDGTVADAGCHGDAPFFCPQFCGSDFLGRTECVDGHWQCEPGFVPSDECPAGTCWGGPAMCCDADGIEVETEVCDNGWRCADGTSVDKCGICHAPFCCDQSGAYVSSLSCNPGDGEYCRDPVNGACEVLVPLDDLGGTWRETHWIVCDTGELVEPEDPVTELVFADTYSLTYSSGMFETYRNYWGSYSYEPLTGRLTMTVEGSNAVPGDLDLDGWALHSGGHDRLVSMSLGMSGGPSGYRVCGHVIERY